MKTQNINIKRLSVLLLTTIVALSFLDSVESSKLKRARRSIEKSDESESDQGKWSSRRRLTMADDVFTTTDKEFKVIGYHRAVGGALANIIGKIFGGIGSLIGFALLPFRTIINAGLHLAIGILQFMKNMVGIKEPEPEPPQASTISSIYDSISDSISSAVYGSKDSEPISNSKAKTSSASTSKAEQKATTKSASLHNKKTLPKATSRGALGKKSNFEDLSKGASAFESMNAAVAKKEEGDVMIPSTSRLASLLPTLVAGFVFTTAGTIVGLLWSTEWREYVPYFGGENSSDSMDDAATSSFADDHDELSSSSAIPVTPDRM